MSNRSQSAFCPQFDRCRCSQGEHCIYCSASVWAMVNREKLSLVERLRLEPTFPGHALEAADEIERLQAMEQRLKSSFTRGTMDSPWLQRNALHLGAAAVAFMRWVWMGEENDA